MATDTRRVPAHTHTHTHTCSKSMVQIVANPIAGLVVDKGNPPLIFGSSLAILVLATLAFAWGVEIDSEGIADEWEQFHILIAARSTQGLASAGIMTSGMATISLATSEGKRGGALGAAMMGVAGGVLMGPPVAGLCAERLGESSVFYGIAGVGCVTLLSSLLFFIFYPESFEVVEGGERDKEERDEEEESGEGRNSYIDKDVALWRNGPVVILAFSVATCNMCVAVTEPLIPLFLEREPFNFNNESIGLTFGVQALCYLLFTPVFGILSDKHMKTPLMALGVACVAGGMGIMFVFKELWSVVLGLGMVGMGIAAADTPSMPLLTVLVPPERFGSAMALQDTSVNLGFLVGPLLAIFVGDNVDSFKWLAVGTSAFSLCTVPLLKRLYATELELTGKRGIGGGENGSGERLLNVTA